MSAPVLTIAHGSTALLLTAAKVRRRRDGLDTGEFEFDSDTELETSLTPGQPLPFIGYSGLYVTDHEPETDGSSYTHRVSAVGVVGTKPERLVSCVADDTLEGFDDGTEVWITTNRRKLVKGSRMARFGNMVCMKATPEELLEAPGWYRVSGQFRGLSGSTKPVKRTISSNVEILSFDSVIVTLNGGWNTARKGQICWPKVTVTFKYWTTYIPVKNLPEQGGTPAGALPSVTVISGGGADLTSHWPNGWRMVAFSPDPISGTTITETTEVWEWQQKVTF